MSADTAAAAETRSSDNAPRVPSLLHSSLARFTADGAGLVLGMVSGIITARWLGPSGKGVFSALTLLSGLLMQICCLGLGDAAIVLVGQKRASIQEALSATTAAVLLLALVGAGCLWVAGTLQVHPNSPNVRAALLAACLGLPIAVFANVLSHILNSQERIVTTSAILILTSGLTTLTVWLLVAVLRFSVAGGVAAGVVGSFAGLITLVIALNRAGLSLQPRWNPTYLQAAVCYGAGIQLSYLLMAMAARLDLLFVYSLASQGAAGQYSVALTFGALVGSISAALSVASFPRLAHLGDAEAIALTVRLCRLGVATALPACALLLMAVPAIIPILFGKAYRPAELPTLILLPGGVFWSVQWLLSRASAARGNAQLLFRSFGASLAVMCVFDFLLIPHFGIGGAAAAATAGPASGMAICLFSYCRREGFPVRIGDFMPTAADFGYLAALGRRLVLLAMTQALVFLDGQA